jgi:hypothetical protein
MEDFLLFQSDIEVAVPCKWCGVATYATALKECVRCWELRHRMQDDIKLTELILKALKEI